jgi:integrase
MKSFTEESASRKTEVHHEDFQSLLTSSQMWNLFNSPLHNEFEKRFEKLDDPENEFVELRNYLITLLLQSAQRPGAVCNLTINEFQAGEWDESTSVKQFVTLTKRHKTAGVFCTMTQCRAFARNIEFFSYNQ